MTVAVDVIDLAIALSSKSIGAAEVPANSNRGPYVERVLKAVGLGPGFPWCAAEVSDVGAAMKRLGVKWPLPLTASCVQLAEFAEKHGILMDTPERGDVFVLWETVKENGKDVERFAHTGFCVTALGDGSWQTHDGNTNGGGSREGWLKAEKIRRFKPKDRFIRWAHLL